ncbi:hypothetical protein PENTCL1PPCAC_23608, partial [Pristionchus entomophagus]
FEKPKDQEIVMEDVSFAEFLVTLQMIYDTRRQFDRFFNLTFEHTFTLVLSLPACLHLLVFQCGVSSVNG